MPKVARELTGLAAKLDGKVKRAPVKPLWDGPESESPQGGVTQSMLSEFLVCPERFRVKYVLGLRRPDEFNKSLEFGNMWHICEETLAAHPHYKRDVAGDFWEPLKDYGRELCQRYPTAQEQVEQWYDVVRRQFPVYVQHWEENPDVLARTPLLQEQVFNVPYELPSNRVVRLRGKWDAVDLIGGGPCSACGGKRHNGSLGTVMCLRCRGSGEDNSDAGVYLQENKTKGDIDEVRLQRQLRFDLQTMMYLVALYAGPHPFLENDWVSVSGGHFPHKGTAYPIRGVRYNVIRRPFSGGKGSIRQHQPTKSNPQGESKEAFYERLIRDYIAAEPGYWFMRWKVEISPDDVERFKTRFLDPTLERLCHWYDWVRGNPNPFNSDPEQGDFSYLGTHWQYPFGTFNPLTDGSGSSDLDAYLETGDETGLVRAESLFEELV